MRVLETVCLSIWVGAMTAFAFIFAPAAFHVVTDLDVFARLVSTTITAITYLGFACAGGIAGAILFSRPSRTKQARALCLGLMVFSSAYELAVIIPAMHRILLDAGGSIAALTAHDPRRAAYDAEHHRSSIVYSITLISGLTALVLRALDITDGKPSERMACKSKIGLA